MIKNFLEQLRIQRWDDHRFYHHSRINQSLHFVSAVSFLIGYVMMFFDPLMSALIGWLVSMTSRQAGHFFFEPRDYDHLNHATHEHKEEIKVGYNLRRKIVLMTIWALSPVVLYVDPTLFGLVTPWASPMPGSSKPMSGQSARSRSTRRPASSAPINSGSRSTRASSSIPIACWRKVKATSSSA